MRAPQATPATAGGKRRRAELGDEIRDGVEGDTADESKRDKATTQASDGAAAARQTGAEEDEAGGDSNDDEDDGDGDGGDGTQLQQAADEAGQTAPVQAFTTEAGSVISNGEEGEFTVLQVRTERCVVRVDSA